jgi:hypothetical protein
MVPVLLRDRVFRRYWSASTVSMFGDQISGVALPLAAVLVLHAGAAQMGYLTALEWLPSLLFGLPAGAIFAAVIPDTLRSRATGAFQAVNYGTRPLGALLGGLLGSAIGLRPALWVAAGGGITGFALLLPTPLPRYRLPA